MKPFPDSVPEVVDGLRGEPELLGCLFCRHLPQETVAEDLPGISLELTAEVVDQPLFVCPRERCVGGVLLFHCEGFEVFDACEMALALVLQFLHFGLDFLVPFFQEAHVLLLDADGHAFAVVVQHFVLDIFRIVFEFRIRLGFVGFHLLTSLW